ncbi:MAG: GTP pyrophosphokinase family protein [Firmicutes bacterium]|nr:GTP pyrophosphokinase family protein [Bacillota bacterium]
MENRELRQEQILETLMEDNPEEMKELFAGFRNLMMAYDCAIREVKTKLEILNDELSLVGDNPIASIQHRRKKPYSILGKLKRKNLPVTLEAIEENLNDIAGIRVICSFVDDIYKVSEMLQKQDDLSVIEIKDYIANPKPNGYRSYHMILEVQIRTVAMDFWASLEHKMKYKHEIANAEEISKELTACAEIIAATDLQMMKIREEIQKG